jgi:Cu(I)/Ag(I) efflux system membrane fusion protein
MPGMYATLAFAMRGREGLLVPAEAVIRTGSRNVVILDEGEGKFRAAEVEVGTEAGDSAEIRKGLKAGDKVVVSGQFLIDSEANLRSTLARLSASGQAESDPHAGHTSHRGSGTVIEVDAARKHVRLEHGPIPSLKWPPMVMGFAVEDGKQLAAVKKGDAVEFELRGEPTRDGDYVIVRIAPKQ